MRHTLSILMENESGALSRVAGLFSARGYNIESLNVAVTDDPTLSRLTLVTRGDDRIIEQIIKQLNKLLDVVKVLDLGEHSHVERELLLVKVETTDTESCDSVKRVADIFRGQIVDIDHRTYTIELTGGQNKLNAFLNAIQPQNVLEVARSGAVGLVRGSSVSFVNDSN